jgi:hypothetical protein
MDFCDVITFDLLPLQLQGKSLWAAAPRHRSRCRHRHPPRTPPRRRPSSSVWGRGGLGCRAEMIGVSAYHAKSD